MKPSHHRARSLKEAAGGTFRFLRGMIRSLYEPSRFEIKRGYIHRHSVIPHDDRGLKDAFQKDVYEKAASLMKQYQWSKVIDVGCGSGYKLIHHLGSYQTLGIDVDPAITQAKMDYPSRAWRHADAFIPAHHTADLILCADVIEHVEDPDAFLKSIFSIPNWKCVMISTPERNLKRGWFHFGPSPNPSHWREWSGKEFNRLVLNYHPVYHQEIVNRAQATQMIICFNP